VIQSFFRIYGADGGSRTHTVSRMILSHVRLPFRHIGASNMNYNITFIQGVQYKYDNYGQKTIKIQVFCFFYVKLLLDEAKFVKIKTIEFLETILST
jgi:hypothetical protein